MDELQAVNTSIIRAKLFFIVMLSGMAIGTLLTILLAMRMQHVIIVVPIGIFIFWICPTVLFQNKFRRFFSNRVSVKFYKEYFLIEIFRRKTNEVERVDEYKLIEIESFKIINFSHDDSSFLKLILKNGIKKAYTFLGQNKLDSKTDVTDLVSTLIIDYNNNHRGDSQIYISPNLFASKAGSYFIIILTILLIVVTIFQIRYKPKTIPFTLFGGAFLYLQIMLQRRRDKKDVEEFNKR